MHRLKNASHKALGRSADTKLAKLVKRTSESLQQSADLQRHYANVLESPTTTAASALAAAENGHRNPVAKHQALTRATDQFFTVLEKVEVEVAAIEKARLELPDTMLSADQAIRSAETYTSMHRQRN